MLLPKVLSVSTAQSPCDFCVGCAACGLVPPFPVFLGAAVAIASLL